MIATEPNPAVFTGFGGRIAGGASAAGTRTGGPGSCSGAGSGGRSRRHQQRHNDRGRLGQGLRGCQLGPAAWERAGTRCPYGRSRPGPGCRDIQSSDLKSIRRPRPGGTVRLRTASPRQPCSTALPQNAAGDILSPRFVRGVSNMVGEHRTTDPVPVRAESGAAASCPPGALSPGRDDKPAPDAHRYRNGSAIRQPTTPATPGIWAPSPFPLTIEGRFPPSGPAFGTGIATRTVPPWSAGRKWPRTSQASGCFPEKKISSAGPSL